MKPSAKSPVDAGKKKPQTAAMERRPQMSVNVVSSIETIDIDGWADSYVRMLVRVLRDSTSSQAA